MDSQSGTDEGASQIAGSAMTENMQLGNPEETATHSSADTVVPPQQNERHFRDRDRDRDRSPQGSSSSNGEQLQREPEFGEGVIEISGKGFGFLRDAKRNFVQTPQDIFVTPEIVRRFAIARRHVDSGRNAARQSRPAVDAAEQDQRRRADEVSGPDAV